MRNTNPVVSLNWLQENFMKVPQEVAEESDDIKVYVRAFCFVGEERERRGMNEWKQMQRTSVGRSGTFPPRRDHPLLYAFAIEMMHTSASGYDLDRFLNIHATDI